ncbi:MAG: hypothetical protein M1823_003872 [Watsoniomyces obsoletus]|nr:MAG: hypothetical protein M1823_003872 [Watsoniomyces obsoletus]
MAPSKRPLVPPHWPLEIVYLTDSVYSPQLNSIEREFLGHQGRKGISFGVNSSVRVRRIEAPPDHPARGQYGLFASKHLAPGTVVLDYLGYVHSSRDTDASSDYDLSLDRERGIGIDATRMGNEARFINDYRGIRDSANVEFIDRTVNGERRMSVQVRPAGKRDSGNKGIAKGEELLVNYGKGFWRHRQEKPVEAVHEASMDE